MKGQQPEESMDSPDFDFDSIDGIDDADLDSVFVLIKDKATGDYGWHWIYRDTLADHGLYELASNGLSDADAAHRGWL